MDEYMKREILNNRAKLGIFIVEGEREVTWNEEINVTIILRNYGNIAIKEIIIDDFWSEWSTLVNNKSNINYKDKFINNQGKLVVKNINDRQVSIINGRFKIKAVKVSNIRQAITATFKYIDEDENIDSHKVIGSDIKLKIYESLIDSRNIEKTIIVKPQNHTVYLPLNYDAKLEFININEVNGEKESFKIIGGKVYINIYYKSDDGNFDNIQEEVEFENDVKNMNLKIEQLYASVQNLLIKIVDGKKILTTIKFNIYKVC